MLSSRVSVHDIQDVEAFVRSMLQKTRLKLAGDEREELVAEGIAILFDLASKYKPRLAGYERDGSFAGYCSMYLPKKMWAAWHRWHPEHLQVLREQEDGSMKKRYEYGDAPESLDKYLAGADDDAGKGLDVERVRSVGNFVR